MMFALGVMLVQLSHKKFTWITSSHFNFSSGFLKIIRYMGLLIIIYNCYGVIITVIITD